MLSEGQREGKRERERKRERETEEILFARLNTRYENLLYYNSGTFVPSTLARSPAGYMNSAYINTLLFGWIYFAAAAAAAAAAAPRAGRINAQF